MSVGAAAAPYSAAVSQPASVETAAVVGTTAVAFVKLAKLGRPFLTARPVLGVRREAHHAAHEAVLQVLLRRFTALGEGNLFAKRVECSCRANIYGGEDCTSPEGRSASTPNIFGGFDTTFPDGSRSESVRTSSAARTSRRRRVSSSRTPTFSAARTIDCRTVSGSSRA